MWLHVQTHMLTHSFADVPDTHVTLPGHQPSLITSCEEVQRNFLNIKKELLLSGIIFNNVFIQPVFNTSEA